MEQAHHVVPKLGAAPPLDVGLSDTTKIILVVEDSPLIRLNAVSAFEEAGFGVLQADSADAAIVLLEDREGISLVFTDVSMPGTMDGLELVVFVRNRWPAIRLIVASGQTIIEEAQLPADAVFFRKPYADVAIVEAARLLLMQPCGTLDDT